MDLRSVLRDAVLLMSPLAETARVRLEVIEPASRVPAFVDPSQMQQAVANIVLNAIHATAPDGVVSLAVQSEPTSQIEVRDSGAGIAPEHLPRIFEPFFTTKAAGVGTGLGLSVTAGIIQEHGGTISVQSEVGRGTTFRILLESPEGRLSQSPATSDFATGREPPAR